MTVERVDVVVGAGGENAQRVSHDQDIKVCFDIRSYKQVLQFYCSFYIIC